MARSPAILSGPAKLGTEAAAGEAGAAVNARSGGFSQKCEAAALMFAARQSSDEVRRETLRADKKCGLSCGASDQPSAKTLAQTMT